MALKIVFMGTPDFAVPSLARLHEAGYPIVGVVTATDKQGGRGGKQLLQSAVKKYALRHDIPVLQPSNLKDEGFQQELRSLGADLQVVVAFRMLPEAVWAMPRLGTFNLHGSLLPRYRGAAPINWAVINGDRETGVTTFFIQQEIDTGDLLLQRATPIGADETAGEVHDRMMHIGADLVLETVQLIESGDYQPRRQDDSKATPAPKLFHETCRIDFVQTTRQVHDFIRGLSPWPGAWTTLDDLQLKVVRSRAEYTSHSLPPGTVVTDNKKELKVACADGYVHLLELQLQGRKRMDAVSFLNGYTFAEDVVLG